jgi:hypothetical protein
VFDDVLFELALAYALGTSFLADRNLQLEILDRLNGRKRVAERNALLYKYLTTIVPFAPDVPIGALFKLRQRESEAFLVFRDSLTKAVDTVSSERTFDKHDAQELYSDVVLPSLSQLDVRVKSAQKDLIKGTGTKALAWSAALGIGILSGIVPKSIESAVQAMGVAKIMADLAEGGLKSHQRPEAIRQDKMYFLWKVRQHAVR